MERSDLTNAPINADEPVPITCVFSDGRRRRVTVTAAEAARLATNGRELTTPWSRVRVRLAGISRRALPWIAGVVIGSLLLPALTKQWSDRQAALTIQQSLFQILDEQSTVAASRAEDSWLKPRQDDTATRHASSRWLAAASRVDGYFTVYFPGTSADLAWIGYRRAVFDFITLSYPYAGQEDTLRRLHSYLDGTPAARDDQMTAADWRRLSQCVRRVGCDRGSLKFFDSYARLHLDVVDRRGAIEAAVRDETPAGFSESWRDLVRDVVTSPTQ